MTIAGVEIKKKKKQEALSSPRFISSFVLINDYTDLLLPLMNAMHFYRRTLVAQSGSGCGGTEAPRSS